MNQARTVLPFLFRDARATARTACCGSEPTGLFLCLVIVFFVGVFNLELLNAVIVVCQRIYVIVALKRGFTCAERVRRLQTQNNVRSAAFYVQNVSNVPSAS